MNIGIITSGGDCPGLNAVIRAIVLTVKNNNQNNKIYGFLNGFEGLCEEEKYKELNKKDVENIERIGGTILGTTNKGMFKGIGNLEEPSAEAIRTIKQIKNTKEKLQLDGIIVTGGDGSLRIAYWIGQQAEINIIGIPKTIDNDLANTDITLGFNTAVDTATQAISKIRDTAQSHRRTMIIEVMGRNAGWIALNAGVAGGADCILIPEIPYNINKLISFLHRKAQEETNSIIIVMAEGAHPKNQKSQYPHNGEILTQTIQIHQNTYYEARLTVLGYIQRGGEPTTYDKILATRLGEKAANLMLNKEKSKYLAIHKDEIKTLPLAMAAVETRVVPTDHELIKTAKSLGIYFGD